VSSRQLNFSYNEIKVKHRLSEDLHAFQLTSPVYIIAKKSKVHPCTRTEDLYRPYGP